MKSIEEMLSIVDKNNGSDLHLITNALPTLREDGIIKNLYDDDYKMSFEDSINLIKKILNKRQLLALEKNGDADTSFACKSIFYPKKQLRARVNVFKDLRGYAFAFRLISKKIPTMQDLLLPKSVKNLTQKEHGLIVVTGPTGSGKSTTIASMLDYINETKNVHIITIEEPVEYYYDMKQAIISQREIGENCISFATGLKAALREDPDIILVGEMRDAQTIEMALAAAETGHLVLTTLHTANVIQSIDRMMQYFSAKQQGQILAQLANSFECIIAQKLLPKNGGGRVAAFEILLRTTATVNLIRNDRAFELKDYMNSKDNMQTMKNAVEDLKRRKYVN